MGETTFMKQKNGNNWRSQDKLVISPDRIKSDPKFARVRENSTEFTTAAHGGLLFRSNHADLNIYIFGEALNCNCFPGREIWFKVFTINLIYLAKQIHIA